MKSVIIGTYELFENGELYKKNTEHKRVKDGYMLSPFMKTEKSSPYYRLNLDGKQKELYVNKLLREYFGIDSDKGKEWSEQIRNKAEEYNGKESRIGRRSIKKKKSNESLQKPFIEEFKGLPDDVYDSNLICPF